MGGGGSGSSYWSSTIVEDAQEIVKGEVWSVTTHTRLPHPTAPNQIKKEMFYVLEHTCEVIGHPIAPAYLIEPSESKLEVDGNLRADWLAYINHRQLPAGAHISPPPPLLANLRWQNQEEYYQGLSKHWIKRIAREGDVGVVKKALAERYVLACVVGNRYDVAHLGLELLTISSHAVSVADGCLLYRWNRISQVNPISPCQP